MTTTYHGRRRQTLLSVVYLVLSASCDSSPSHPRDAGQDTQDAGLDARVQDAGPRLDAASTDSGAMEGGTGDGAPVECEEKCGDGIVCGTEECDPGASIQSAGPCLSSCRLNLAFDAAGACGDYPPAEGPREPITPRSAVDAKLFTYAEPIEWTVKLADVALTDDERDLGYSIPANPQVGNIDTLPGTDVLLGATGFYGTIHFLASSDGMGMFPAPVRTWESTVTSGYARSRVGPFDFNGDGLWDYLTATRMYQRPAHIDAAIIAQVGTVAWKAPLAANQVNGADLDGDGKTDLYHQYIGVCGWSVIVVLSHGNGTFSEPVKLRIDAVPGIQAPFQPGEIRELTVGDVTGEGAADLLRYQSSAEGMIVEVAINRGAAVFTAPVKSVWAGLSVAPALRDIDGDKRLDLVFITKTTDSLRLDVAFSRGDGTFSALVSWSSPGTFAQNRNVHLMDVNDDGRADLVPFDGTIAAGRGDGTFSEWFPVPGMVYYTGHFNADGKTDLLLLVAQDLENPGWTFRTILAN